MTEWSAAELKLAWLMWCYDQGYLKAEDRATMANWMYEPQAHPDDEESRLALLAMAREVLIEVGQ